MNSKKEVQHVYLVGAKSLGAYGGYETFVYKLTEYHQNKENIKYHVACKANGDGCMDESKFDGVTRINEHEFELHNKEKPDLIISCGAAVAVPFFYIGKMMGAKLVYIEVFDRIDKPTMTGKMVYPIVDKFVVQWEEQKKVYPKAVNLGSIF